MNDDRDQEARGKVAMVLHRQPGSTGAVGRILSERGYTLDILRPKFGDRLPDDLASYRGAIIFGGPNSANDDDAFVREEIAWIGRLLDAGVPYLGLCLGGQMLARLLGGQVARHPDGMVERGYYPIAATSGGEAYCAGWPRHVYQWHQEGFEVPRTASVLAGAAGPFPNQAFMYGDSAIGLQFHPEITYMMVNRWSKREDQLTMPGAFDRRTHFAQHLLYSRDVRVWLARLLETWLQSGRSK